VSTRDTAVLAGGPFLVVGGACIVAGGLVAAVTGPLHLEHGSWAAAYLVLVGGVAQIALGAPQGALAARSPSPAVLASELAAWNLGSALVIGGTLVRNTVRGGEGPGWARWTYRGALAALLASIPIGLVLAHLRAR
jgi:hypothetical protein